MVKKANKQKKKDKEVADNDALSAEPSNEEDDDNMIYLFVYDMASGHRIQREPSQVMMEPLVDISKWVYYKDNKVWVVHPGGKNDPRITGQKIRKNAFVITGFDSKHSNNWDIFLTNTKTNNKSNIVDHKKGVKTTTIQYPLILINTILIETMGTYQKHV